MILNIMELKRYIDTHGMKQKYISMKTGIPETKLSLILNGKRRCEVGEYASICKVLGVDIKRFITKDNKESA